jgi:prolyl oligopeptidase
MKQILILLSIFMAGCSLNGSRLEDDSWLHEIDSARVNSWVDLQSQVVSKELLQSDIYSSNSILLKEISNKKKSPSYTDGFYIFEKQLNGLIKVSNVVSAHEILYTVDLKKVYAGSYPDNAQISCLANTTYCIVGGPVLNKNESNWIEFNLSTSERVINGFSLSDSELVKPLWVDSDSILYSSNYGIEPSHKSKMALNLKLWNRGSNKSRLLLSLDKNEANHISNFVTSLYGRDGIAKIVPALSIFFDYSFGFQQAPFVNGTLITEGIPKGAYLLGIYNQSILYWLRKDWVTNGKSFSAGAIVSIKFNSDGLVTNVSENYHLPNDVYLDSAKLVKNHLVIIGFKNAEMIIGDINLDKTSPSFEVIYTNPIQNIKLVSATPFSSIIEFSTESLLDTKTKYQFDLNNRNTKILEKVPAQFNTSGMVEELKFAKSRDGKLIPYRIAYPKVANGNVDTILYTSGVYGVSRYSTYSAMRGKLWLEKGKAFIISHPRGGSELGPNWYIDGLREKKLNTVNDVADIAKDIVRLNITSSKKIALLAGRGGGAVSGAVGYKYPELFGATYHEDSSLDLITWADHSDYAEFGDPNTDDLEYLEEYSPYQQLVKGKKYPASLLVASRYDPEVHPGQSRKTAKRLHDLGQKAYFYETNAAGKRIVGKLAADINLLMYTFFEIALQN